MEDGSWKSSLAALTRRFRCCTSVSCRTALHAAPCLEEGPVGPSPLARGYLSGRCSDFAAVDWVVVPRMGGKCPTVFQSVGSSSGFQVCQVPAWAEFKLSIHFMEGLEIQHLSFIPYIQCSDVSFGNTIYFSSSLSQSNTQSIIGRPALFHGHQCRPEVFFVSDLTHRI